MAGDKTKTVRRSRSHWKERIWLGPLIRTVDSQLLNLNLNLEQIMGLVTWLLGFQPRLWGRLSGRS